MEYYLAFACAVTGGSYFPVIKSLLATYLEHPSNQDKESSSEKKVVFNIGTELYHIFENTFASPKEKPLKFQDRELGKFELGDKREYFQKFNPPTHNAATEKIPLPSKEEIYCSVNEVILKYRQSIENDDTVDRMNLQLLLKMYNLNATGYYKLVYVGKVELVTKEYYQKHEKWIKGQQPVLEGEIKKEEPFEYARIDTLTDLLKLYPKNFRELPQVFKAVSFVYYVSVSS